MIFNPIFDWLALRELDNDLVNMGFEESLEVTGADSLNYSICGTELFYI